MITKQGGKLYNYYNYGCMEIYSSKVYCTSDTVHNKIIRALENN